MGRRAFKRSLLGYRRSDVDAAIAQRDAAAEAAAEHVATATVAIAEREQEIAVQAEEIVKAHARIYDLERVATRLSERVVEREAELRALRAQLAGALAPNDRPVSEAAPPSANGHHPEVAAPELFEGLIEVEVGPLHDFAQLVGFEDAANGMDATAEISVKRFAKGRATLELHLSEPVELLRQLEENAPFEFRVRDTRGNRLVLDVDAD